MSQTSAQAMNHHHQQQLHDSNIGYQSMQQPSNAHIYASNYDARSQNDASTMDDDFGAVRQKSEGAAKAFACSTCQKGFARRSDLARHGTLSISKGQARC